MAGDLVWPLVNVAVLAVTAAAHAVLLWWNARANRRQLERLSGGHKGGDR